MNDEELQRLKRENAELREQLSLRPFLQRSGIRSDAWGYVRSLILERYDLSEDGEFTAKDRLNTPASWHRYLEGLRSTHSFLFTGSRTTNQEGKSGGNPWAKTSWNLTQQALLTRRDPGLAKQMASEAGG
jgi:hypothetical protein